MGRIREVIKGAQESVNSMSLNADTLRTSATHTIQGACSALRGSGSVITELGRVKDACVALPVGMAGGALKACAQLATFQPIKATCTVAGGLTDACKNLATMVTSPIPTAVAACEGTLKAAGTVIKLPVTAPLAACRVAKRGVNRIVELMDGKRGAITPVSAPAENSSNSAPPMAQAA